MFGVRRVASRARPDSTLGQHNQTMLRSIDIFYFGSTDEARPNRLKDALSKATIFLRIAGCSACSPQLALGVIGTIQLALHVMLTVASGVDVQTAQGTRGFRARPTGKCEGLTPDPLPGGGELISQAGGLRAFLSQGSEC